MASCVVAWKGATIRENEAPFVILVVGKRIDLVTTEDEDVATSRRKEGGAWRRFRSAER